MALYYEDDAVRLYCGDWAELIDEGLVVDVIVTDPPYGETRWPWDVWPAGWPVLAARHAPAIWCFGSMRMFLEQHHEFASWRFSQDLVWEKHNGSNLASDRFARIHEHITLWYQGAWASVYHQTPTTPDASSRTIRKKTRPTQWIGQAGANTYVSHDGGPRLMRSVLKARSMHGRAVNETQKPTQVLEPLITYSCPPGGTVLDLFAGSGSTGVAAKLTGRKAVLFELREEQCEKAARRLAQDVLDLTGTDTA